MSSMWWLNWRRKRLLGKLGATERSGEENCLAEYYRGSWPSGSSKAWDAEFLSVDLETTSLDASEGEIISIGWVPLTSGTIDLSAAGQVYIRPESSVGQSAVIHHIRDEDLKHALPLEEAMCEFLQQARNKILVFHHAPLDMAFLNAATQQLYGQPFVAPVVDTLNLEWKKMNRNDTPVGKGELRLAGCRERYNLPDYPAHDALTDALAAAELYLAWALQYCHVGPGGKENPLKVSECL